MICRSFASSADVRWIVSRVGRSTGNPSSSIRDAGRSATAGASVAVGIQTHLTPNPTQP